VRAIFRKLDLTSRHDVAAALEPPDPGAPEPSRPAAPALAVEDAGAGAISALLFADLVDSTSRAATLGDRAWTMLRDRWERVARDQVAAACGVLVKTTGDGIFATFASPRQAVLAALALREELQALGLELRAGVHAGECVRRDGDVHGIAVHVAARIMREADAGEVLVSRTIGDLLLGSPIRLDARGEHELRGVPGTWSLLAAAAA